MALTKRPMRSSHYSSRYFISKCRNSNRVKLCKWTTRKLRATKNVFKVECCGSSLLTSNRNIWAHCKTWNRKSLTKAEERATGADGCRCVSVQKYSVQYKGYNLIGVTTVEASTTRGTTALVYCLINSSLYTGTVQQVMEYTQLVMRSPGV